MVPKNINKTVFVIVIYKPRKSELKAILKVLKSKDVIIVDNSQSESDILTHKRLFRRSGAKLILAHENIGYPSAANLGISYALNKGADWIITLTPDLTISRKQIDNYCSVISKLGPCLVGPLGGGLDKKRWTTIFSMNYLGTIDYLSGGFLALHRNLIDQIGYLNGSYFMYYDDVDFSIRAKKAGFRLLKIPIIGIEHNDAPVLGRNSFLHQYYHARNHLFFVELQAPIRVKMRELVRLPKTVWEHYQRGEIGALHGIKDYFFRKFGEKRL